MDQVVSQITLLFPEFSRWFAAGMIVFARLLGFISFAPVFNRKEIAGLVKLAFVFLLTVILTPLIHPTTPPNTAASTSRNIISNCMELLKLANNASKSITPDLISVSVYFFSSSRIAFIPSTKSSADNILISPVLRAFTSICPLSSSILSTRKTKPGN